LLSIHVWALKAYFRLLKFPIDRLITQQYRFWSTNSGFALWEPIFTFLTPKIIYFLHLYKISDQGLIFTFFAFFTPNSLYFLRLFISQIFTFFFNLTVKFDLQKYKAWTFLESGSNLPPEKVPYCFLDQPQILTLYHDFSILTAYLREEDLKRSRAKVLLSYSYATFKTSGLMNSSKNENHSTLLYEKFKWFNTVQLWELTVTDPLKNPTLNFDSILYIVSRCYNKLDF
jgi:hypothetical protein